MKSEYANSEYKQVRESLHKELTALRKQLAVR
jgi:hypothetical protein